MYEKSKRAEGNSLQPSITAFMRSHGTKRTATDDEVSSSDDRPAGSTAAPGGPEGSNITSSSSATPAVHTS